MKHLAGKVLAVAVSLTLLGAFQNKARAGNEADPALTEQGRIDQGFRIAPVHLNLAHKDLDLVGLGSYLVNAVGG